MSVFEVALAGFKEHARDLSQSHYSVRQLELAVRLFDDYDPTFADKWPQTVHELFETEALHLIFAPRLVRIQRRDFVNHPGYRVGNYVIYLLESAMNRAGGVRGVGFCIYRASTTEAFIRDRGIVHMKPFWHNLNDY